MNQVYSTTQVLSYGFQRRLLCIRAQATATRAGPQTAASPSSSSVLSIIPWAIQNKIQFANIKPVVLNDGDRGVIATYDIYSNECICSVPAKAALRTYPGCSPVLGVPSDAWQQLPWFAQLALILLAELAQGRSSKFADYLAVLPKEVDVPVLWTEAEQQQLQCSYIIEQVKQQKQEWTALAQKLDRYLRPAGLSKQQLFWALSVARSRAFAAPYAAAPLSTAPKIFLAAQVIATAAWLAAGATAAVGVEVLGAAAAAGVGFMLLQQPKTQQQHAMCPLLDMFNHEGRQQSECELDTWTDAFRVVASRPWRQGEQVYISYGQSSSDVLLQLYGFVEPDNVHERYLVRALLDAIMQQGFGLGDGQQHSLLKEVPFARAGIPTPAAAALEHTCKQPFSSNNGNAAGITPFAALSSITKSICAAAVAAELQQLAVNTTKDFLVLQAARDLPAKQQELASLQESLQKEELQLQQLQRQLAVAQQEEQQQQQQAGMSAELSDGITSGTSRNGGVVGVDTRSASVVEELEQLAQNVATNVSELRQQEQQLQQLVDDWQDQLDSCKLLAVQFRCEKHQLLESILVQLHT